MFIVGDAASTGTQLSAVELLDDLRGLWHSPGATAAITGSLLMLFSFALSGHTAPSEPRLLAIGANSGGRLAGPRRLASGSLEWVTFLRWG